MLNGMDYNEEVKKYRHYIDLALAIYGFESPAQLKVSVIDIHSEQQQSKTVDQLLDEYNDYNSLYNMFGDDKYKLKAEHAMFQLSHI